MPSVLITGANRGLGFGLAQLYADDGWRVFACCRKPDRATDLKALVDASGGSVTLHRVDMQDLASIDALAADIADEALDVLLNVAGYYGPVIMTEPDGLQEFGTSDYEEWTKIFSVNVFAVMRMAEAFVDHVAASDQKKIITLSSQLGSMGRNTSGKIYPYRASKAAANALMRSMAVDLKGKGIIAVPIHPGWVRTEMGGPEADIDPDTSVRGVKAVIGGLTLDDSGVFFDYEGKEMPW